MSNCSNTYSQYVDFVKFLLDIDPKYTNYNEVANFILTTSDLSVAQQIASLSNIAKLYLDNSELLTVGEANQVLNASALLSQGKEQDFIKTIQDLFNTDNIDNVTATQLYNSLIKKPIVLDEEIKELISKIKQEGIDKHSELIDKLKVLVTANKTQLAIFNNEFGLNKQSEQSYVPISNLPAIAPIWLMLSDYTQVYGTFNNKTNTFTEIETGRVIPVSDIIASKNSHKEDESYSFYDSKSNIWQNRTLNNNLILVPLAGDYKSEDVDAAYNILSKGVNYKIAAENFDSIFTWDMFLKDKEFRQLEMRGTIEEFRSEENIETFNKEFECKYSVGEKKI